MLKKIYIIVTTYNCNIKILHLVKKIKYKLYVVFLLKNKVKLYQV